jgi:hypothetical protein
MGVESTPRDRIARGPRGCPATAPQPVPGGRRDRYAVRPGASGAGRRQRSGMPR